MEPEWKLQAYISRELHLRDILHHGDQNAGRRGPKAAMMAKATGMRKGWPDMIICMHGGHKGYTPRLPVPRTIFLEIKTEKGVVSKEQKQVHDELRGFGYEVYVIKARTGLQAWRMVEEIIGCREN